MFRRITRRPKVKVIALIVLGHPAPFKEVEKPKEIFTAIRANKASESVNVRVTFNVQIFGDNLAVIKDSKRI